MSLKQLTQELINYKEDTDPYEFNDVFNQDSYMEIFMQLLDESGRKSIINALKNDIQETRNLDDMHNAIRLISAINKL